MANRIEEIITKQESLFSLEAEFGRSKEKRKDCRLVTLGLVLDSEGFVKRSEILPGNVSEGGTLKKALTSLNVPDQSVKPMHC